LKRIFTLLVLLFSTIWVNAQTTKGTDFCVNFLNNIFPDSMFVIVAAPTGANVTVDMPASTFSTSLTLVVNELRKIYIPTSYKVKNTDTLTKWGIHIVADKEVIVYAISAASYTTDATCVLPTSSIPNQANFIINPYTKSSKIANVFSIVVHDSNTIIEITPTSNISSGRLANQSFTKTLHKGDVFIVRNAGIENLVGSTVKVISTDKKVSVYQGNDCINIDCGACDHLFEVVLPTTVYGKNFVLTPFFGAGNGYRYNIMSTKNNTIIERNGTPVDTIDIGEQYVEKMGKDSSICISTNNPVIITQIMIGCHAISTGDPAIVYVVPLEQTIKSGIISTANTTIIKTHYINILLPKTGIQRFYLDGVKVPSTDFNQVYCGDYYFYSAAVSPGSHTIDCDDGFIGYVYGMGGYESYAYFAGASLRNLQLSFEVEIIPNCDSGIIAKFTPKPDTLSNYKWFFPDGSVDTNKSPTKYFPMAGNYNIRLHGYSASLGWDSTQQLTNIIDTTPKDFIPFYDKIVCADSFNIVLPGKEAYNFLWNTGDTNNVLTVKNTGKYSVVGTNKFTGCTISDSCNITMNDKVHVNFSYAMERFCPGYPMIVIDSSKVTNDVINKWEWYADFEIFSTNKNDTIKSPRANFYDIKLKIYTNKGCIDSLEQRVVVDDAPVANFRLITKDSCVDRGLIAGYNTSYIVIGKMKRYVWEYSDGFLDSSQNGSPFRDYKDTGTFWMRLRAESTGGCVDTSAKKFFTIFPAPKPIAKLVDSMVCITKNSFQFNNLTQTNGQNLYYSWQWGDGTGTGLAQPPPKTYADTGTYKMAMVAGYIKTGCTDTFRKDLRVFQNPIVGVVKDSFSECLNKNYSTFHDNSDAKGATNKYYKWIWGDGTVDSGMSNPTKIYANTGAYKLTYVFSTGKGCEDTIKKNINVYQDPIAGFDITDASLCLVNNYVTLNNTTIGPANTRFDWSFGNGTTGTLKNPGTINYTDTGKFIISLKVLDPLIGCRDTFERTVDVLRNPKSKVVVNDTLLCVTGNQFSFSNGIIQSFGNPTFKWLFSDGDSALTEVTQKTFSSSGTYTAKVIVYNGLYCADTASATVKVGAKSTIAIQVNDTLLCASNAYFDLNIVKNAGPNIVNYTWNLWADKTQTIKKLLTVNDYQVMAITTNDEKCMDSAYINLHVVANPKTTIVNNTLDLQCLKNNQFSFQANTNGTAPTYLYNWVVDLNNVSSGNTYQYSYNSAKKDVIKVYTQDANNCRDTATYKVEIFEQPEVDFANDSVCIGDPIQLYATVLPNGIPNLDYTWNLGDGNMSKQNPAKHKYQTAETAYDVFVIIKTADGCADTSETKVVYVYDKPIADFNYWSLEPSTGAIPYTFKDSSLNATGYNWTIDNKVFNEKLITYNFKQVGTQQIKLRVVNNAGCADSITKSVIVESPSRVYMAQSFTPNADGLNDFFGPEYLAPVKDFYFAIFNRWGEKIFETKDPTQKWDGSYQGQPVMSGSYTFMLNVVFQNHDRKRINGMVTVLK